jgi:ribosomal protein L37AE/L43A
MYKKNAMAFDINFNDKKRVNTIENKPKTEVIPNEESPNTNIEETRYECPNCGRKFKREAYRKHVPICQRVFQGKKDIDVSNKDKRNSIKDSDLFESKSKPLKKNSKWENQSNELRAIIQSKRAEKEKDKNKNEIKIEIEEPKKHNDNNNKILGSPTNNSNTRALYSRDSKGFLQCELCNKKFTKINFESHLNDCKLKYKDKKNGTFNRGNIGVPINNNINNNQMTRKPLLPAVTYGRNKPNFSVKFGK